MKKKKLFILQPKIQHYRLPIFDKINIELNKSFDLMVLGKTDKGQAINGGKRSYIFHLDYKMILGIEWWSNLLKTIIIFKPSVIVHTASPRNLSSWLLILISKILNIKLIGWSKINSDHEQDMIFKKKIKHFFYSNFKTLVVYGKKSLLELKKLNVNNTKIFIAYNTIDTNFYDRNPIFIRKNILKFKKKYSLDSTSNIFLCIGRMINEKKQANIIDAWNLSNIDKKLSKLIFVGSGPNLLYVKSRKLLDDKSIIFVGNVPIGFDYVWLGISNFSIFGGALGLACQQSFLMKSLVIAPIENSVDSEFLKNEKNSILYNKNDIYQLTKIIENIVLSKNKIKNKNVIDEAYRYITIERSSNKMANQIVKAIKL